MFLYWLTVQAWLAINLMDAILLCFNIEVYVFMSMTQQKLLKYQLYFS